MHPNDSIMCGYFCIGSIEFMLEAKSMHGYTNLLSPNEYENNDFRENINSFYYLQ